MGQAEVLFEQLLHLDDTWKVDSVRYDEGSLIVEIKADKSKLLPNSKCPECDSLCRYHDTVKKKWRSTDIAGAPMIILCDVPRTRCISCGRTEPIHVPWADLESNFTKLFEEMCLRLAKDMPINCVARFMGINKDTLWNILGRFVDERLQDLDLSNVDSIYIDEKAVQKGHSYVTNVLDQDHKLIFMTYGNDASTLTRFRVFLESHKGHRDNIKHVSSDMGSGFKAGVALEFPNAKVTYDRFHVMQHMTDAVDSVRRREWRKFYSVNKDEADRIKSTRFLFLHNYNDLDEEKRETVRKLLTEFKDLGRVYVFKESLRATWMMPDKKSAISHLNRWLKEAKDEAIEELTSVVNMIENHFDGILRWYDSNMSNGVIEGFHSVMQGIQNRARGFRKWENLRSAMFLRYLSF